MSSCTLYLLQVTLLEKFPDEGGKNDPRQRIIPFLPGKKLIGRSHIREVAVKRLKPIDEYCRALIRLPTNISECGEVLNFFETTREDIDPPKEDNMKEKKNKKMAESISEPLLLDQYIVIADYEKSQPTEMSVKAGTTVDVIEKNENGWWFVTVEDEQGWVPATFLDRADGLTEEITRRSRAGEGEQYVTTNAYNARGGDEVGFDRGVNVEVLEKNLEGWWYIRYQDVEGWAPSTYLEKPRDKSAVSMVPTEIIGSALEVSNLPNLANHRRASNDARSGSSGSTTPEKGSPRLDNRKSAAELSTNERNGNHETANQEIERTVRSRPTALPLKPSENKKKDKQRGKSPKRPGVVKRKEPPPRRDSIAMFMFPSVCAVAPPVLMEKQPQVTEQKRPPVRPPPPQLEKEVEYVTLADFQATMQDGISFQEGEKLKVIEKSPSGWWFVTTGEAGTEGWAPASYIERRERPKKPPPPISNTTAVPKPAFSPPVSPVAKIVPAFEKPQLKRTPSDKSTVVKPKFSPPAPPVTQQSGREKDPSPVNGRKASPVLHIKETHQTSQEDRLSPSEDDPILPAIGQTDMLSEIQQVLASKQKNIKKSSPARKISPVRKSSPARKSSPVRKSSPARKSSPVRKSSPGPTRPTHHPPKTPQTKGWIEADSKDLPSSSEQHTEQGEDMLSEIHKVLAAKAKHVQSETKHEIHRTEVSKQKDEEENNNRQQKAKFVGISAKQATISAKEGEINAKHPTNGIPTKYDGEIIQDEEGIYVTCERYERQDTKEISFSKGQKAEVLEKNTSGWWFVRIGSKEGWAPSTYLGHDDKVEEEEVKYEDVVKAVPAKFRNGNDVTKHLPSENKKPTTVAFQKKATPPNKTATKDLEIKKQTRVTEVKARYSLPVKKTQSESNVSQSLPPKESIPQATSTESVLPVREGVTKFKATSARTSSPKGFQKQDTRKGSPKAKVLPKSASDHKSGKIERVPSLKERMGMLMEKTGGETTSSLSRIPKKRPEETKASRAKSIPDDIHQTDGEERFISVKERLGMLQGKIGPADTAATKSGKRFGTVDAKGQARPAAPTKTKPQLIRNKPAGAPARPKPPVFGNKPSVPQAKPTIQASKPIIPNKKPALTQSKPKLTLNHTRSSPPSLKIVGGGELNSVSPDVPSPFRPKSLTRMDSETSSLTSESSSLTTVTALDGDEHIYESVDDVMGHDGTIATEDNIYIAAASYHSDDAEMLSFDEGEELEVLEMHWNGWWYAAVDKRRNMAARQLSPLRTFLLFTAFVTLCGGQNTTSSSPTSANPPAAAAGSCSASGDPAVVSCSFDSLPTGQTYQTVAPHAAGGLQGYYNLMSSFVRTIQPTEAFRKYTLGTKTRHLTCAWATAY
uniref:SH3 and PX domain-containing protein 2A n=1 Tax=Branchiostoma floridae TaxID=7739 RepID=C3YIT0_BRAFL|eukprot:XP_002603793.1 hypothetical protein BRAFLDRAFT_86624 [Branchiostoma floridae]